MTSYPINETSFIKNAFKPIQYIENEVILNKNPHKGVAGILNIGPSTFQMQARSLGVGYLGSAVFKSLPLSYQHQLKEEFTRLYPEAMNFLNTIGVNAFTAPLYLVGTVFVAHKLFKLAKKWYNFIRSKKDEIKQVAEAQQQQQQEIMNTPRGDN